MNRRFPVRRLTAALAVMLAVQPAGAFFAGGGGIKEGDPSPMFTGQTIDNQPIDFAQMKGKKVVMLDFWSIYCASCIEEMPRLVEIYNEFKDKGLVIIGVNLDSFGTHRVVKFMQGMETRSAAVITVVVNTNGRRQTLEVASGCSLVSQHNINEGLFAKPSRLHPLKSSDNLF